jgi:hypothetical protein
MPFYYASLTIGHVAVDTVQEPTCHDSLLAGHMNLARAGCSFDFWVALLVGCVSGV